MNSFSERLKEERVRLGLSQVDFAEVGGVQRRAQVNYESGERSPDALYLERIASVGVDVSYLVTGRRAVGSERLYTRKEVEQAGHGMLYDAALIKAINIDSEQTYDLLHLLLMKNLAKVTGMAEPAEGDQNDLKVG